MASLDVTTIARVKTVLNKDAGDSAHDQVLEGLIKQVSTKVEQFIGRELLSTSRTETYDGEPRMDRLCLNQFPVSAVTSVKVRASVGDETDWATITAVDDQNYELQESDGRSGVLLLNFTPFVGRAAIQVVYTAGFGTSAADLLSSYPDVVSAAERQVAFEFQRWNDPGGKNVNVDGMSEVHTSPVRLLPAVAETLWAYKGWTLFKV